MKQQSHIKLKEIIYEITGKCLNACKYCGSKDVWNEEIDEDKIKKIAGAICEFPPNEINISGGDATLVSYDTHKQIVEDFRKKNVLCKILINPKSLTNDRVYDILQLYDAIGMSISTSEELGIFRERKSNINKYNLNSKITVISNFNITNIFSYEKIESTIKTHNYIWQIQYTVYKDSDNEKALYNNEEALNDFKCKIANSIKSGLKIVIADNANSGRCSAGLYSIGILSNGNVIGCLSYRSWLDKVEEEYVEGNILQVPLKDIWEQGFENQRFGEFMSCKEHCKNKCVDSFTKEDFNFSRQEIEKMINDAIDKKLPFPIITYPPTPPSNPPITVYYGVSVYAVWTEPYTTTITTASDSGISDKDFIVL